ncbi:MAG: hypothetical protein ACOC1O_00365 [bacterium]
MNSVSLENFNIIKKLVKNHFSLDEESYNRFVEKIDNPTLILENIPKNVREYLDDDLRARFKLNTEIPGLDKGWMYFQTFFSHFVEFHTDPIVTYENYRDNFIVIDGQRRKLIKYLVDYYSNNVNKHSTQCFIDFVKHNSLSGTKFVDKVTDIKSAVICASEYIGSYKKPNKEVEIVISFNFADWFLCSTSEEWGSCINLNSDYEAAFWAGLPGLLADPNRGMLYITDGRSKEYRGITIERFLNRSWLILNEKKEYCIVKLYPSSIASYEEIRKAIPDINLETELNGYSYYDFVPYFNKNGNSLFIYQDNTSFTKTTKNNEVRISSYNGGEHQYIVKNEGGDSVYSDSLYEYYEGLNGLVRNNEEIINHVFDSEYCSCTSCGNRVSDEVLLYGSDDLPYCESCFDSYFSVCTVCGLTESIDNIRFTDYECYCEHCYNERFVDCHECGESVENDEALLDPGGHLVCDICFEEHYAHCEKCDKTLYKEDLIETEDGEYICEACDIKEAAKNKTKEKYVERSLTNA